MSAGTSAKNRTSRDDLSVGNGSHACTGAPEGRKVWGVRQRGGKGAGCARGEERAGGAPEGRKGWEVRQREESVGVRQRRGKGGGCGRGEERMGGVVERGKVWGMWQSEGKDGGASCMGHQVETELGAMGRHLPCPTTHQLHAQRRISRMPHSTPGPETQRHRAPSPARQCRLRCPRTATAPPRSTGAWGRTLPPSCP